MGCRVSETNTLRLYNYYRVIIGARAEVQRTSVTNIMAEDS